MGIAERTAAGHLQASDLQRERDAQMVARGISAPLRGKNFDEDSCMDICDWMSGLPSEADEWF